MICLCGFWGFLGGVCWEDLSFFWFFFQPHLHEVQYCPFPFFCFFFVCSFVFIFISYFLSFFFHFSFCLLVFGSFVYWCLSFCFSSFLFLFSTFFFFLFLFLFVSFFCVLFYFFLVRLGAGSFFSSVLFSEPQLQANL